MSRCRLRTLARRVPAADDRVVLFSTWYRGHTNARYAELLPRLERLDAYLLAFPGRRVARAATTRTWGLVRGGIEPAILRAASRRYRAALVVDAPQLVHLTVPSVVDLDDPRYERDAALLMRPEVAAYVVTAETAARRFEELGVDKPWHVIPQGVALERHDPELRRRARGDPPVAGYVAAFLLLPGDRGGDNPLYDVSHLLDLWDEVRARVPQGRLRLVGRASERLRRRLAGRADVVLTGPVSRERLLAEIARFDVALYPRAADQGVRAVKVAEYLGAGVPIVSYDYRVVEDVREAGAGILAQTPREFVAATERLLADELERARFAEASRAAGLERDWRLLSRRYADLLDAHLPPARGTLAD
jgi:glycosyltransferase involved in cell wall biosynthesis